MKKILLLFAHPKLEKSIVNKALLGATKGLAHVEVRDLYELYPDFMIDVEAEQAAVRRSDVLLLQFPFFWYSCPALLKEWLDVVLANGFAFGKGGDAVKGKPLINVVSTGSRESSYSGDSPYSAPALLSPFAQTAWYCDMNYAEPFIVYGANDIRHGQRERLTDEVSRYRQFLVDLGNGL